MVVKEDGTKWACQSCLKGHRVSGCTHTDRPLYFVPKKGRPVTQCQHCRVERKKRSAHVKCDCGERQPHHPKDKCVHLRNTEATHNGDSIISELGPVPEDHELEDIGCCCHHGGNCTCATLKKEHGSESPDHAQPSARRSHSKPRLTSTQSDGHLTVFANGHHKPVHRHNNAAHENNLPYKMPRSHTDHGPLPAGWRKSVDSIVSESATEHSTTQIIPSNTNTPDLQSTPEISQSVNSSGTNPMEAFSLPIHQDLSMSAFETYDFSQMDQSDLTAIGGFNVAMTQPDISANGIEFAPNAWSMSAPDGNSAIDWDNVDWAALNNFDTINQPALTYASSNTLSEFGEHTPPEEYGSLFGNQSFLHTMQDASKQHTEQPTLPSFASSSATYPGVAVDSTNRWSLPASFWTGMTDTSAPTSSDSVQFADNVNTPWTSSNASYDPPTLTATKSISALRSHAEKTSKRSHPRPRPRAVYQKANTTSGTPGWEQLLQDYQAGSLWGDTEQLPMQGNTTSQVATDNYNRQQNLEQPVSAPSFDHQDSNQFFMDPEPMSSFELDNSNFSTSGFHENWSQ